MTASSPQTSAGRRRLRLFLLVLVLLAIAWQLTAFVLNRSLDSALAEYNGPSLEIKSHVPPRLPAGTPNGWDAVAAAEVLIEGQETFRRHMTVGQPLGAPEVQKIHNRFRELDRAGQRPTAADLELFRTSLANLDLPMMMIERALREAAEARFYADYTVVATSVEIPNHLFSLNLASLLRARAEIALAEGRPADAWQSAKGIYRLAYWNASATRFLISGLVVRAIAQQGAITVQHLLAVAPGDAAARAEVLAEASRIEPGAHFDQLYAAEKAAMYSSLLDPRLDSDEMSAGPEADRSILPSAGELLADWDPWRRYNAAHYLRFTTAANQICSLPAYRQGADAPMKINAARFADWIEPAALLTFDCLDSSNKRDLWKASIDQLAIAVALEDFREKNSRYPQTLSEAGGGAQTRVDPFSGKPYLYRPEGSGYLLYSVSLNGKDDGGQPTPHVKAQIDFRSGDWIWRVAPTLP